MSDRIRQAVAAYGRWAQSKGWSHRQAQGVLWAIEANINQWRTDPRAAAEALAGYCRSQHWPAADIDTLMGYEVGTGPAPQQAAPAQPQPSQPQSAGLHHALQIKGHIERLMKEDPAAYWNRPSAQAAYTKALQVLSGELSETSLPPPGDYRLPQDGSQRSATRVEAVMADVGVGMNREREVHEQYWRDVRTPEGDAAMRAAWSQAASDQAAAESAPSPAALPSQGAPSGDASGGGE